MRRKPGSLIPLEVSILEVGVEMAVRGQPCFHGFLIAKRIKEREDARLLTAHGTLYRALDRMQKAGLLESQWEDPALAAHEGRPRRRLYQVTFAGETALANTRTAVASAASVQPSPGPVTP